MFAGGSKRSKTEPSQFLKISADSKKAREGGFDKQGTVVWISLNASDNDSGDSDTGHRTIVIAATQSDGCNSDVQISA